MTDDTKPERITSKAKFNELLKLVKSAESEMAESRGLMGERLKTAQDKHHLDLKAFRIAKQFDRMDGGKREHLWRTVKIYIEEYLRIGSQADLEDAVEADAGREAADNVTRPSLVA